MGLYIFSIQYVHFIISSSNRKYDITMNVLMSTMAFKIAGILTVCSTYINETIKAPRHWPLWGKIRWSPVDSPHKEPVMRKMFPWLHGFISHCSGLYHETILCSGCLATFLQVLPGIISNNLAMGFILRQMKLKSFICCKHIQPT